MIFEKVRNFISEYTLKSFKKELDYVFEEHSLFVYEYKIKLKMQEKKLHTYFFDNKKWRLIDNQILEQVEMTEIEKILFEKDN